MIQKLDLHTGAVVFVGDGNGAEALQPFWRRLKRSRARIEALAMVIENQETLRPVPGPIG